MGERPLKRLLWWCNHLLRLASWIVPRGQRVEWLREWEGEVWHWGHFLMESGRLSRRTEKELLRHCWGAFADATWHRFNRIAVLSFFHEWPRTPRFCIFAILAALVMLLAGDPASIFSGLIAPPPYADPDHLMTIFVAERSPWLAPELLRDWVLQVSKESQLISGGAAYAWRPSLVRGPSGTESILSARVTPGLFGLLGIRPSLGRTFQETDLSSCGDCAVLSDAVWRSQFHRDGNVIGRSLFLDSRQVQIVGVLPPHCRLAAREIGVFSPFGTGSRPLLPMYEWPGALLRAPTGLDPIKAREQLETLINQADSIPANTKLGIISVRDLEYEFLESCLAWFAFALLFLLALMWRPFARLVTTSPRGNARDVFRWWVFFALKSALLLMAILIICLDLVRIAALRSGGTMYPVVSAGAMWLFWIGATLALTWSIRDHFGRCRSCLKRFGAQVNLGSAGDFFLERTGTELVCDGGHGVLHIPRIQSSCVDSERWSYLDESWSALFGEREKGFSNSQLIFLPRRTTWEEDDDD